MQRACRVYADNRRGMRPLSGPGIRRENLAALRSAQSVREGVACKRLSTVRVPAAGVIEPSPERRTFLTCLRGLAVDVSRHQAGNHQGELLIADGSMFASQGYPVRVKS